jgi:hypothetical protein
MGASFPRRIGNLNEKLAPVGRSYPPLLNDHARQYGLFRPGSVTVRPVCKRPSVSLRDRRRLRSVTTDRCARPHSDAIRLADTATPLWCRPHSFLAARFIGNASGNTSIHCWSFAVRALRGRLWPS